VLGHYFGVPVAVEPHAVQCLAIELDDRSRLSYARNRAERAAVPAARLGRSANAGTRVRDRQYRFRLRIGPLTLAQYASFLPDGPSWQPLADWVRLLAGPELGWELQLELLRAERPPPRLGRCVRLGVSSWLATGGRRGAISGAQPAIEVADRASTRALRLRPATCFLLRRPRAGGQTHA
jgi:type VI secretion system protein ImpH